MRADQHTIESSVNDLIISAIQARVGFYDALTRNEPHLERRSTRRSLLDTELAAVDTSLADLKRRRNLLAPASACPPEVLALIFRLLAELEPNHYADPKDYLGVVTRKLKPRMGWMKVTQVCYSWRRAAHADGRLWTTVTTSLGMWWAAEMLRLSRGLPVHLDLHSVDAADTDETLPSSLVYSHMQRVSSLRILGGETISGSYELRAGLPIESAPLLDSLAIHTKNVVELPPDTLIRLPNLQKLYLHDTILVDSTLGSQITELTLGQNAKPDFNHPARDFILLLGSVPKLERLCVKNYHITTPDADTPLDSDGLRANCPNLVDITLHCPSIRAVIAVFSRLGSHPSAKVDLAGLYPRDQDAVFEPFVARLQNLSICLEAQTLEWRGYGVRHVPIPQVKDAVDVVYERTLTLSAWRNNRHGYLLADYAGYRAPPSPDLKLTIGFKAFHRPYLNPEDVIPWPHPFPSARNVSFQPTERYLFNVFPWSSALESFPQLRWLRVDRQLAEDFMVELSSDEDYLPKSVKTLALLGVTAWQNDPDHDDDDDEDEVETTVEQMLADIWTRTRKASGALSKVTVGIVSLEEVNCDRYIDDDDDGIVLDAIMRPDWLGGDGDREEHEDWDTRTDW